VLNNVGMELSFYALDWIGDGIYRFGLLDQCIIPSDKNDCNMIEDAYCIIKTLEVSYCFLFSDQPNKIYLMFMINID